MDKGSHFDQETADLAMKTELTRFGVLCERLSVSLYGQRSKWPLQQTAPQPSCLRTSIRLQCEPREQAAIHDMTRSGNDMADKSIWAITQLCLESSRVVAEARDRFVPALLLYGELDADDTSVSSMSHFLPCLQELSVLVGCSYALVSNMAQQLNALYTPNEEQRPVKTPDLNVDCLFESLAALLSMQLTLDQVIANQRLLKSHWQAFLRAVNAVHSNPKKFDMDTTRLRPLETVLQKLNEQLFTGHIYENCATHAQMPEALSDDAGRLSIRTNGALAEQCLVVLRNWFNVWNSSTDLPDDVSLLNLVSLFGFYSMVFRATDKKLVKQLWESHKKLCSFPLAGSLLFTPCQFLWHKVPLVNKCIDFKTYQALESYRNQQLQQCTTTLAKDTAAAIVRVSEWTYELQKEFSCWQSTEQVGTQIERRAALIQRGLFNANSISRCIRTILGGFLLMAKQSSGKLPKSTALFIFRLTELLQHISSAFAACWPAVLDTCGKLQQRHSAHLLKVLANAHNGLKTDKHQANVGRVDMLSGMLCAEQLLAGPASELRVAGVRCALGLSGLQHLVKAADWQHVLTSVARLHDYAHIADKLTSATDCSFLAWHTSLVRLYFECAAAELGNTPDRLTLFALALDDCVHYAAAAQHLPSQTRGDQLLARETLTIIEQTLLSTLCALTETQLRLATHTHLQLDSAQHAQGPQADRNLAAFFSLPVITLGNECLDIKRHVERYLERTFYNLTAVALHDWHTYAKMRHLAFVNYGLHLIEPHLPSHQLDQGLDVLSIMRKIHVFTENYNYNLNMQCFVEKCSSGKYVNTLSVPHAANSIRTHGLGICNTTVNYTYKFIRQKFYIFSQFLYDDQIRSQLIKDSRYFKENFEQLHALYPPQRAEKFNREIRSLGVTPDDLSYLDQFRMLCTQIGNALGYVRLMRAGGLEAQAQAIHFVPDLDDIVPLLPLATAQGCSAHSLDASHNFDQAVAALSNGFCSQGTEYFKLLVDVFSSEFRNYDKYAHLKNFYMIVPPLIVNFVEHMRACKDRIGKRALGGEAAFSDDGFSMGVAYILKLLDQNEAFDSLHWFKSWEAKYKKEKDEIAAAQTSMHRGKDEQQAGKFTQAMALRLSRINLHRKEMQLVQWALRSARVFFRSDDDDELIARDKDNEDDTASVKSAGSRNT